MTKIDNKNYFEVDAQKTFEEAYTDYSSFVIQRRSTPDVRDFFKFTQRQIMYAQYINKLRHKDKFQKSQKSVAAAMSHSYVHGDSSAYSVIVHLCRPFYTRYFMEDFVGSIMMTGNTAYGSSRYTECRLSKLTENVFAYIGENVLPTNAWNPTYDDSSEYPVLFPSLGYYNICNGAFGSIGVGIASSVPQFNLNEVNTAICELLDNPNAEIEILPDFASGGILLNPKTTLNSLANGKGKSVILRGEIQKYPDKKYLEIKSLPYGVYTDTVCAKIAEKCDEGSNITDFKDLSQDSVNIRVYAKDLDKAEQWLYKETQVQNHFTINMIMLDKGKTPKYFSLKEALLAHIDHAKEVYRKHYEYQLIQLRKRMNIIEGLLKAYSILDDVIELIKQSSGRANAITQLISKFDFNQEQAEAIVDLRLHRLSSLDIQNLQQEKESNQAEQDRINEVLNQEQLFNDELKEIYRKVANEFGDERRTKIYSSDDYEAGVDGSAPTKQFYLSVENEIMTASYVADDKMMLPISLDDDIYFITTGGRTIYRKGSEIFLGTYPIRDKLNILKGEHLLMAHQKNPNSKYSYIEFIDKLTGKSYSIHKSFIESGTPRGKKFTAKKVDLEYKDYSIRSKLPSLR